MARFLILYLAVTGVLALIAVSMPYLVLIGMFLIVPGLILMLAPTAFLWGIVFAMIWFVAREVAGDWPARGLGVLGTLAVMWLIPQPSVAESRARLAAATLPDVTPAAPLAIRGDVRIALPMQALTREAYDPEHPNASRMIGCNGVCAAMLFTDGVKSVTLMESRYVSDAYARANRPEPSPEFRTFVRLPHAACETSLRPTDAQGIGLKYPDGDAKLAEWNLRLSTSDCITSAPTPDAFDLSVIQSAGMTHGQSAGFSGHAGAVRFEWVEMRGRDGALLLRKSLVRTDAMAVPLSVGFGSSFNDFGPRWSRTTLSNAPGREKLELGELLMAHTRLAARVDKVAMGQNVRARLRQMLDDPRVTKDDSGWETVATYFEGLEKSVDPQDRLLVVDLIRDRRNQHFRGIWAAIKGLGVDGTILRAPIVDRLAAESDPGEEIGLLGRMLDTLPAGSFAVPSGAERALLADPALRLRASGLVMRQADRGAAAVPELMSILDYHARSVATASAARRPIDSSPDWQMIDAVRLALCRLGPQGAGALPRIAALDESGILAQRLDQDRDWQVTLIRLGRSADTMAKPANMSGTEANFRARQRARAAESADRACSSNFI